MEPLALVMPRIGILGASGRMGRAIARQAEEIGFPISGGMNSEGAVLGTQRNAGDLAAACDVLIDFSSADALSCNLAAAEGAGTPILVGTTGLAPEHHALIDRAAETVAVLQTFNTSLGLNMLRALVGQAARALGPDWDIEIVEMHHRHKLDTPSGSALLLGTAANIGRGAADPVALNRFDRMQEGPHAREEGGIYYASLRGGSVAGDHKVIFATEGERIELGHIADSRRIFAKGALRGAQWLIGQPPGRYTMGDVLGL